MTQNSKIFSFSVLVAIISGPWIFLEIAQQLNIVSAIFSLLYLSLPLAIFCYATSNTLCSRICSHRARNSEENQENSDFIFTDLEDIKDLEISKSTFQRFKLFVQDQQRQPSGLSEVFKNLKNKQSNHRLLLSAVSVIFAYFVGLHPASGFFGGMPIFFLGWMVPSLVNILFSLWLASLFTIPRLFQGFLFVVFSFVLGLNTNLYTWITEIATPQPVTYHVEKIVEYPNPKLRGGCIGSDDSARNLYVSAGSFLSPITLGGNEGCGCMYFKNQNDDYLTLIKQVFFNGHISCGPTGSVRIVYSAEKHDEYADVTIKIYENDIVQSWWKKENLLFTNISARYGRMNRDSSDSSRLLNGYFIANTFELLLKNNAWSYVFNLSNALELSRKKAELASFIDKAMTYKKYEPKN